MKEPYFDMAQAWHDMRMFSKELEKYAPPMEYIDNPFLKKDRNNVSNRESWETIAKIKALIDPLKQQLQQERQTVRDNQNGLTWRQANDLRYENESLKNQIKGLNVTLSALQNKLEALRKLL